VKQQWLTIALFCCFFVAVILFAACGDEGCARVSHCLEGTFISTFII
jgi:hypothetical protein